jgi:hypothetical protein
VSKLLGRTVAGTGFSWVGSFDFYFEFVPWNPLKYQHRNEGFAFEQLVVISCIFALLFFSVVVIQKMA